MLNFSNIFQCWSDLGGITVSELLNVEDETTKVGGKFKVFFFFFF